MGGVQPNIEFIDALNRFQHRICGESSIARGGFHNRDRRVAQPVVRRAALRRWLAGAERARLVNPHQLSSRRDLPHGDAILHV
jgi:hypothetical protein